jgi:hypothetical protein
MTTERVQRFDARGPLGAIGMIVVIESLKEKDGKTGQKLRDDPGLIAIAMSLGKNFKVHYKTARSADDLEFLLNREPRLLHPIHRLAVEPVW